MSKNKSKKTSQKDFLTQLQKFSKLPAWAWGVIIGIFMLIIAILYLSNFQIKFNSGNIKFDRKITLSPEEIDLSQRAMQNVAPYPDSEKGISNLNNYLNGSTDTANNNLLSKISSSFSSLFPWNKKKTTALTSTSDHNVDPNKNKKLISSDLAKKLKDIPGLGSLAVKNSEGWVGPGVDKSDVQNGQALYMGFGIVRQVGNRSTIVRVSKYVDHDLTLTFPNLIKVWVWQPQQNDWQMKLSTMDIKTGDVVGFRWWAEDMDIADQSDLKIVYVKLTGDTWKLAVDDMLVGNLLNNIWIEK